MANLGRWQRPQRFAVLLLVVPSCPCTNVASLGREFQKSIGTVAHGADATGGPGVRACLRPTGAHPGREKQSGEVHEGQEAESEKIYCARWSLMSTTEIQLVFEGTAVQSGKIEARLLAESLAGCSEIFRRANQIANGEASEAAVLVESEFKAGSFVAGLQLEQHIVETAKNLITHHEFLTAGGLAALIGFIKKGESIGESPS